MDPAIEAGIRVEEALRRVRLMPPTVVEADSDGAEINQG